MISISGKVIDAVTGDPLENTHVYVQRDEEPDHGTVTNKNGYFQLTALEPNEMVLIRHVGYHVVEGVANNMMAHRTYPLQSLSLMLEDVDVNPPKRGIGLMGIMASLAGIILIGSRVRPQDTKKAIEKKNPKKATSDEHL